METNDRTNLPAALGDDAPHLLVVDDDTRIRNLLKQYLTENGFRVTVAGNAGEARRKLEGLDFDLLVIDVMMPGENGVDLTKSLRDQKSVPILMLTALSETDSRIAGLEAGADDYLPKPFQFEELIARVRALIRRSAGIGSAVINVGAMTIDPRAMRVSINGVPQALTPLEYRLLSYLGHHQGRIVPSTELQNQLYGDDFSRDANALEVLIARLRKKLGPDAVGTRRGFGYYIGGTEP